MTALLKLFLLSFEDEGFPKTTEEHLKLIRVREQYNEINEKLSQLTEDDYSKANQVSRCSSLKVDSLLLGRNN